MLIGEKIKSYRIQVGLSQEDLAYELDISRQTISSWENNKTYPGIRSIIALSGIFHISVEEFIKEDVETMKDILDGYKAERIKRNKDRDILNRMVAVRAFLGFVGALTVYPVYQYLGWPMLLIPASMSVGVVALTFPIENYRKKYNLRKYQDIVAFFDEKYNY